MRALGVCGLVLLAGCGPSGNLETLKPDAAPPAVLKAAVDALPATKIDKAWKGPGGDYFFRGKDAKGKHKTAQVTPGGKLVKVE